MRDESTSIIKYWTYGCSKGAVELEFAVKKLHKLKVEKKGSTDYVTEVDRRVEQIIFEDIKSYYPEHNFLGRSQVRN